MTRHMLVLMMTTGLLILPLGCGEGEDYTAAEQDAEPRSSLARAMEEAERDPEAAARAARPEPEPADEADRPDDQPEPPQPADDAEPAVIEITGNDQMQFNIQRFEVRTGQPVRLVFKNIGVMPKAAMGHNLVILHKGVDMFDFGAAGAQAGLAREYLPEGREDEIFAHTPLLGPGEEATLEFTAPEPGEYPYVCTFVGHFALMNGHMVVTD